MSADRREATIRQMFPLVRQIARRVSRVLRAADVDDLIGDGSIGLIRAVDSFDLRRGTSLEAYAGKLIVGAMLNGVRRRDPVSERVRRTLRRADDARFSAAQQRGSLQSLGELERGDPRLRRARVAAYHQAALSLDAPLPPHHHLPCDGGPGPANEVAQRARSRELAEAIALLPERQRRILSLHYEHDVALHVIGSQLRVSPQRVSQLHLSALARLRHFVSAP